MSQERKCGQCSFFDPMQVDKTTPFGAKNLDNGQIVRKGVCRVNKGLRFGILDETRDCRQQPPQEHFIAINSRQKVNSCPTNPSLSTSN